MYLDVVNGKKNQEDMCNFLLVQGERKKKLEVGVNKKTVL